MNTILNVENIVKTYGKKINIKRALNHIQFSIMEGEFVSIMGPSGSGKTTLLNCISTIDAIDSGHIYLNNQDMTNLTTQKAAQFRKENLGFIFQDFNLLDTLSIEENIALPLSISNISTKKIQNEVKKIMQRLSIEDIASKFPMQVSGGQKQRCACARAFIGSPNLILADEPTGALDSVSAKQLLELLNELNIEEHTTILMVTHDPVSASYGNRVLFLKDGYLRKELCKDNMNRKSFYHAILAEISLGEGEQLC